MSDDAARELAEKIDELKRGLEEPPRDPRRELGEGLLEELNRSRLSSWYTLDQLGDDDAAA
jgi:hypothetical protein